MDRPRDDAALERRKQARLRMRPDLAYSRHLFAGAASCVIKDPVSLRYFRFPEKEYFLIRQLDGRATLEDVQKAFERSYRPDRIALEDLEAFGQELMTAGLAVNDAPHLGRQLHDRRQKQRRDRLLQTLTNILSVRVPLVDPDGFLARLLPGVRWMFTAWFLAASTAAVLAAVLLAVIHLDALRARLPDYEELLKPHNLLTMWLVLGAVKVVHELGHGFSCKAFGGEVHDLGGLLLCFSPAMYCDVSDAWVLPSKWQRMVISGAGIWVELILASLAGLVWWTTAPGGTANRMAMCLMVVCSVSTVVFNANPLMRYDGYYVLADWLEIPNLAQRGDECVQRLLQEWCLGMELPPDVPLARWRRALLVAYAVASWGYRWTVTFGIVWFLSGLLRPYRMENLSALLAVGAAATMVGRPLYSLGKAVHRRGGLPDMKARNVVTTLALAGLTAAVLVLVPLPVTQVRQPGVVQVQPAAAAAVYVPALPGPARSSTVLARLDVRDGERVAQGHVLAEFRNHELDLELEQLQTQLGLEEARIRAAQEQLGELKDEVQQGPLRADAARAEGERGRLAERVRVCQAMRRQLVLRAPHSGTVLGPPRVDDVGRAWEVDRALPFCRVGDPARLRVVVPVSTADYKLLRDDDAAARADGGELVVDVRSPGSGLVRRRGRLAFLPGAEAREIPWALTAEAGGPVSAQATAEHRFVPDSQYYLIAVDLVDPEPTLHPGTIAQVKIHCRRRTAGYWLWRTLGLTFDLGFMRG